MINNEPEMLQLQIVYPTPMDYFKTIYKENLWKNHESISGDGSTLKCAAPYLKFLNKFIKEKNIKTILDVGCGDFNLMKHVDLKNIDYLGIDLIEDLINNNNLKYTDKNIKFKYIKIHDFIYTAQYDLILCKDVLQHWSNQSVMSFLKSIKNYKYCLLINDYINEVYHNKNYNVDVLDSEYTVVDLTRNPYNINGEYIFEWHACDVFKKCFLLKNLYV